jgi:hypothetical protein
MSGQLSTAFPYLVLHHEEFTWPRLSPTAPVSSYLTVSPITFGISKGWNILCCTCRHPPLGGRPDVIRLVALWCSDFPLLIKEATAQPAPLRGRNSIAKNVERLKPLLPPQMLGFSSDSGPASSVGLDKMCPLFIDMMFEQCLHLIGGSTLSGLSGDL